MPTTRGDAYDYYQTNGTTISIASLPVVDSKRTIENVVLDAASNPYGATNDEGIYVIDCLSQDIRIRDCRIVATLVLVERGGNSEIAGSVNWSAAVANYPVLLGRPDVVRLFQRRSRGIYRRFNPTGTPYAGSSDSDVSDTFPSVMMGWSMFPSTPQAAITPSSTGWLWWETQCRSQAAWI